MASCTVQLTILLIFITFICRTQQRELNRRQAAQSGCECGAPNRRTRIVGGQPTQVGEYPWMVAIFKETTASDGRIVRQQICGAALISTAWLLSAAHCTKGLNGSRLLADLGDYDFTTGNDAVNSLVYISTIIAHPGYSQQTQANDIALLQLSFNVTYTNNIRPICIPPPNLNCFGQQFEVTGWGTLYNNGPSSNILQEVSLPVISNAACKVNYTNTNAVIDNSVICTMFNGDIPQDACQGDSGGPAAMLCNGRYLLTGIISYSLGCANVPGVYTNVSFYRAWIVQNTYPYTLCGYDCYPPPPSVQTGCGVANNPSTNQVSTTGKRKKRVIGGSVTQPNQYPWMAGVYTLQFDSKGDPYFDFECGATLISNQWVLTAAKCVYGIPRDELLVTLGDYDQSTTDAGEQDFDVASYVVHPDYNDNIVTNNIALIKLNKTVTFGRTISPICLPSQSSVPANFNPGTPLTFIGWGVDQNNKYPMKLKQVVLTTISNNDCSFVYGSSVDSSTVCTANNSTSGVCLGDKGGPLMMIDSANRYYEVALQSFRKNSTSCTGPDPAGNLEIAPYLSWITTVTGIQPVTPVGSLRK